jgi:hypothetical protein
MVHRRSDEAIGLPVQQIAQMLVEAGQSNPALLGRSQVSSAGRIAEGASERRPPVAFEHHLSPSGDPYMEQLVSIAVASARLAEDASVQASQTGRMAKRSASMVTVLGAIGGLVGIAGIVDHRYHDSVKPALAAVASDDRPIAEAQPPPGVLPAKAADQPLERAPIDPVALPSTAAPTPDTANRASAHGNVVTAHSSAGQFDDGSSATSTPTVPAASQAAQATNEPSGATVGQAYPTQPYGLYAPSSFRAAPVRAYASPLAQQWPAATRGSSAAKQYHYVPRRYEASVGSGPSGNPVRDFQRFVTAMGQGFRSIFR